MIHTSRKMLPVCVSGIATYNAHITIHRSWSLLTPSRRSVRCRVLRQTEIATISNVIHRRLLQFVLPGAVKNSYATTCDQNEVSLKRQV
jgi:hypothetical protein